MIRLLPRVNLLTDRRWLARFPFFGLTGSGAAATLIETRRAGGISTRAAGSLFTARSGGLATRAAGTLTTARAGGIATRSARP